MLFFVCSFLFYLSVGFESPLCGGTQRNDSVCYVTATPLALCHHSVTLQEDVSVNQAS